MGFPAPGAYEASIARINEERRAQAQQDQMLSAVRQTNYANTQREGEIRNIYDEIIRRYQPGGSFETKSLAELDRLKKRSVNEQFGQSEQQAISGGMFGVQRPTRAGMGVEWEEKVGAPARLSLEDVLMQRLSGAQQSKASFIEGIQDVGPSLSDIFNMAQAGQSSAGQYSTGQSSTPSSSGGTTSGTTRTTGGTGGSVQGTGRRGSRAYDPSMVGKSLWAQQGTQVNTGGSTASGGGTQSGPAHTTSFQSYYNYSAALYNKTGEKLSQQAAYSKLYGK